MKEWINLQRYSAQVNSILGRGSSLFTTQSQREAIAALFVGPKNVEDVVEMLKLREIYRHLSNAADRGDEAANVIGDIVVKKV